jgi:hypothetical protein
MNGDNKMKVLKRILKLISIVSVFIFSIALSVLVCYYAFKGIMIHDTYYIGLAILLDIAVYHIDTEKIYDSIDKIFD